MHEQKDTFQYVPLVDGLKSLLKKKEIFDEVSYLGNKIVLSITTIVLRFFRDMCAQTTISQISVMDPSLRLTHCS